MEPLERGNVLIVGAAMGGGHLQIGRELARRLGEREHTARVVDILELMPSSAGRWLHRLYPWLVNRAPRTYQLVHDTFVQNRRSGRRTQPPVLIATPGLRRMVAEFAPDVIVSTHPLAAAVVGRARARDETGWSAVTLITTFSVNRLWVHSSVDLQLCISADAAADAEAWSGQRARVCGPVVRPEFTSGVRSQESVRARFGVSAGARVALVTTGATGLAGSAEQAAIAVASMPGWQAVVVCGRDGHLRERLHDRTDVIALGWVEDMASVMSTADVLVDNAAGMCAKEALGIGLPVVTFRPIAGHGRDDTDALARLGLTDHVTTTAGLVGAVEALVTDEEAYADRIARGKALFVEDAADEVEHAAISSRPLPRP